MSRIVFLLEEYSMKALLDGLLPRLFPTMAFVSIPHEGKQDLEKSIPRKLKAWREPGVRFCVIRDNDRGDCRKLKQELSELCAQSGREDALVRIACQELEAWFLGAPDALAEAFGKEALRTIGRRARFRDPDALDRPSQVLRELVEEYQKVSGARRMAAQLTRSNSSRSFQTLIAGLDRLLLQEG